MTACGEGSATACAAGSKGGKYRPNPMKLASTHATAAPMA